jgi:hypothetical protein
MFVSGVNVGAGHQVLFKCQQGNEQVTPGIREADARQCVRNFEINVDRPLTPPVFQELQMNFATATPLPVKKQIN